MSAFDANVQLEGLALRMGCWKQTNDIFHNFVYVDSQVDYASWHTYYPDTWKPQMTLIPQVLDQSLMLYVIFANMDW